MTFRRELCKVVLSVKKLMETHMQLRGHWCFIAFIQVINSSPQESDRTKWNEAASNMRRKYSAGCKQMQISVVVFCPLHGRSSNVLPHSNVVPD